VEAVPCDDLADGLSTSEHARLLGLSQERISCGQGISGKVEFVGSHGGVSRKNADKHA